MPAHLTLFHALPAAQCEYINEVLTQAARDTPRFPLFICGLRNLGRGFAYKVESEPILALHRRLASSFQPFLTRQDAQTFRPHITVQNKVAPAEARATLAKLEQEFMPWAGEVLGLCCWRYRNGPWELDKRYSFRLVLDQSCTGA